MGLNQELFNELALRFELDQTLCKQKRMNEFQGCCEENTFWLKGLIKKIGWPSLEIVGETGERYAWLIAQHSSDLNFQKYCLSLLNKQYPTNERKRHIAYLTDRILIKEGKPQIYGTQFIPSGSPFKIENESEIDKRRQKMGLGLFCEYYELMNRTD